MSETPARTTVLIVGAGVVGCAVAAELASRGLDVVVLEAERRAGEGTTSRNSGVIHAGIYYPPGSLKAETCIEGNRRVYEWCSRNGVPHRKTGKWIVGSNGDDDALEALFSNAQRCGAIGLRRGTHEEIEEDIPGVRADVGLFSAETGIVDPVAFCLSLKRAASDAGATFVFAGRVTGIEALARGGFRVSSLRGELDAEVVVNAAGLFADEVARAAGIDRYRIHPWRGDYFALPLRYSLPRLVYPVKRKNDPGLGVHLTMGLDGSCRLGPDVTLVESKTDFAPPEDLEAKRQRFFEAARRYLPGLALDELRYDTCGLRPKLRSATDASDPDFVIAEDLPGMINLVGIESPGLTAALAIARRVAAQLG